MAGHNTPMLAFIDALRVAHFTTSDSLRKSQARALDSLGFGPRECDFQVISSGPHWRLRKYGGPRNAASLLIVPAPIKRAYIWDLTPSVSAVRYCLNHGLCVYLIEWIPPSLSGGLAGLDEYAGQTLASCVTAVSSDARGAQPFLMGHSLGGTIATIFGALEPQSVRGLVLLGTPLCFESASSPFRDALVSIVPSALSETDVVAGSLLSEVCAVASPNTFLWSRWMDAALSSADISAMDIHIRIECWALDEVAVPGKLVNQIVQWLYRENRLCLGTLSVCDRIVGPSSLRIPILAVVTMSDEIGPLASVAPFINKISIKDTVLVEYPGEIGVGVQHLAMLAGRQAYIQVWPQIISWLEARS